MTPIHTKRVLPRPVQPSDKHEEGSLQSEDFAYANEARIGRAPADAVELYLRDAGRTALFTHAQEIEVMKGFCKARTEFYQAVLKSASWLGELCRLFESRSKTKSG
jgi:hypothetical protein